jgi:hypothetical protein
LTAGHDEIRGSGPNHCCTPVAQWINRVFPIQSTRDLTGQSTFNTIRIAFLPFFASGSSVVAARVLFEVTRQASGMELLSLTLSAVAGGTTFIALFFRSGLAELKSIITWQCS